MTTVRLATLDEIPDLAAVLARAFAHDPFFAWMAGDAPERSQRMRDGWSGTPAPRIGASRTHLHDR